MNTRQHWRSNLKLTWALLALWCVVSFVVPYFARDLNFVFFGWPFSFWVAAQGALCVYVFIVWFYGRRMRQLDEEHGMAEPLD